MGYYNLATNYTSMFLPTTMSDLTDLLSGGVKDPEFQDPAWRKMEYNLWGKQYPNAAAAAAGGPFEVFWIRMHYWWNAQTYEVRQDKFKNKPEEGCAGDSSYTAVG